MGARVAGLSNMGALAGGIAVAAQPESIKAALVANNILCIIST
jgi:hypothetical protein